MVVMCFGVACCPLYEACWRLTVVFMLVVVCMYGIVACCCSCVVCEVLKVGVAANPVFDELVGDGLLRREEEDGTTSPEEGINHLKDRKHVHNHKHTVLCACDSSSFEEVADLLPWKPACLFDLILIHFDVRRQCDGQAANHEGGWDGPGLTCHIAHRPHLHPALLLHLPPHSTLHTLS